VPLGQARFSKKQKEIVMKMGKGFLAWVTVFALFVAQGAEAKSPAHVLQSPNKELALRVDFSDGTLSYALSWQGKPVLAPSGMGVEMESGDNAPWKIKSVKRRTIDERWKPVVGKRNVVENRCNEITVSLARPSKTMPQMDVVFRAYDEGVAFRYVLKGTEGKPLVVAKDLSELNFASDLQAWSYAGERRPLGPETISAIKGTRKYPVVMKGDGDSWLVVTEAALSGVDNFDLSFSGGRTAARVHTDASRVELPATLPWRVIMLSDHPSAIC
jgi:alpha-glucosidase